MSWQRFCSPAVAVMLVALALVAQGQEIVAGRDLQHPLRFPDRSSPRATLTAFLDSGDVLGEFLEHEYLPSPSREKYHQLMSLGAMPLRYLDLDELPPAGREKAAGAAALALYETLNRIELPPPDEIPDSGDVGDQDITTGVAANDESRAGSADELPARWLVPNTRIALVRVESGPREGEYLFSADTVAQANDFYQLVRDLPYVRQVPVENLHHIIGTRGGWMIPYKWIRALPASLRVTVAGQSAWKWAGLAMSFVIAILFLRLGYRLSQFGSAERPFRRALSRIALPLMVIAVMPAITYFALIQLNMVGAAASSLQLVAAAIVSLAGAWLAWRFAPVAAEALIASPAIAPESLDANLIRLTARVLGIIGGAAIIAFGADRMGVPVYGIVAGLGVGGLAIALAAQPTVENLIGGLSLYADRPIRVGDQCKFGDGFGTVESIGIRSSRIRGLDRTLTTIPNAALARMSIINFEARDQMLIKTVIGLRYETTSEQLRYVLAKLREMLLAHPCIHPDPARARFARFGAYSLDIEVHAYAMTSDWAEFFRIREDVLLRVMDVVEESGASIAFPSQTLYLGRDGAADAGKIDAAEAAVRAWREKEQLPFPDFSVEQAGAIRGTIKYPPRGSSGVSEDRPGSDPGSPEPPPVPVDGSG